MALLRNISISKLKGVSKPSYISHEAALSVILSSIAEFKNTSFTLSLDFSPKVLELINEFLDYILLVFLKTSKSIEISYLRNAILNELPTQLGVEAISEADAELQTYIENEPLAKDLGFKIHEDVRWDLIDVWKKIRVKCMVYSTLGNQEKDNFPTALWGDELISPSVSIYTTSVLEFVAEYMLLVVGNACHRRLSETKNSYPIIEERDLNEGLKYDRAILSLWNRWKSSDSFLDLMVNDNSFSASSVDTALISPKKDNIFEKKSYNFETNVEDIRYETYINTEKDNSGIDKYSDELEVCKLTHMTEYLNFDNKETFFPAFLKGSYINTHTNKKLLENQKNSQNESFYNIELLEQDNSNEQKSEYKTKMRETEHLYKVNAKKNQQCLPLKKKSIPSFDSGEKVSVDSSVIFGSDIENTVDNHTLEVFNTTLSKSVSREISPEDTSKLNPDIPKTTFLERVSAIDNINQDSIDPFNTNTCEFSDISYKDKNDLLTSEKLFDEIRKLSLTYDQEKSTFSKEKSENHQFFIHNYNVNNTINHNFVSHKNSHSLHDEISPCYRILKSEEKDYNSHGNLIDMKSETSTYMKDQNIDEISSKNINIFFHSTNSDLLLKTSSKTQINSSINKSKHDDFLISEIPALDKYSETIALCQNANYLNSKLSQDKKKNETRSNKNTFDKLVDRNATMKMFLNPEGLREIDFDNEKSFLKAYSQTTDIPNISDSYNTELISRYCNNVKELPTLDFVNTSSIKDKRNKLQPREPTIPKEPTTSSLREFFIETSMNKIHEFSNSKLSTKYSHSLKTFDSDNFNDYTSTSQVSSTFKTQKEMEKEHFRDEDKEDLNRSYSRLYRREESLIEFLRNSEPINADSIKFQESIPLDDKNKVLYRKIQLYKNSSTNFSEDNIFPKNSNYSGTTRSIYVRDSPSKNSYQTPESIEKKKLSLDNMFLDSKEFFSLNFDDKSIFLQNSLNDTNDFINEPKTNNYPPKHISIKKANIEHKESLTDFLKNTSPLNYNKRDSINNSYASKKKKNTLFTWKKHELQKIRKVCPEIRYPTIKLK
ncbi:hypothetical protein PNEG_01870 [Pneumocystis murina B123]|uniref:Uncharacterized protein n=1 Tax=Pneumocystis murina (strain B123) TaxID=1069680 RepID=M7NLY6_PNEMU|nr:hypothetical protein PNEG_01870 [Pneumocystis murina B123]EMR09683.1 hypothetical protein PNEG_01870 [Pneumocystis murina B123]